MQSATSYVAFSSENGESKESWKFKTGVRCIKRLVDNAQTILEFFVARCKQLNSSYFDNCYRDSFCQSRKLCGEKRIIKLAIGIHRIDEVD